MSNKVFVGGLSWDTNPESLRHAFERIGEVTDATVITDRETGRSRGFGFVQFANPADVSRAIQELNDTNLDGRNIRVSEANERPRRDNRRY